MIAFERELELGRKAAQRAGEIATRYREKGIGFESKSDDSPVTAADRECERVVPLMIEEAFPDDGLLGEEGAAKPSRSGRRWIIDPIDGTRDYVRGIPVWCTLIGLEQDGEVVAGVGHGDGLLLALFLIAQHKSHVDGIAVAQRDGRLQPLELHGPHATERVGASFELAKVLHHMYGNS